MRQLHKAGEKAFVDYSGDRVTLIDTDTGEFHEGFFLSVQNLKLRFTELGMIYGPCLKTIII